MKLLQYIFQLLRNQEVRDEPAFSISETPSFEMIEKDDRCSHHGAFADDLCIKDMSHPNQRKNKHLAGKCL